MQNAKCPWPYSNPFLHRFLKLKKQLVSYIPMEQNKATCLQHLAI